MLQRPGSSWGFSAMPRGIEGGESVDITPPSTIPFGPSLELLDYDSLTIRPRLHQGTVGTLKYKYYCTLF